jgi:hypothetical protein
MLAALLLAGIAYPAMLMATGAGMESASHRGGSLEWCQAIVTADATFPAGDAGTVTLERSTDTVRVVSAQPAEDWAFRIDDGGPDRSVAVVFTKADARVFFRAAIIDCQVRIRVTGEVVATFTPAPVETPAPAPIVDPAPPADPATPPADPATPPADPTTPPVEPLAPVPAPAPVMVGTFEAAQAGGVTIQLADGKLKVLSVQPAADWTFEIKKAGPGKHVRVRFSSDGARIELVARLHKGRAIIRVRSVGIVSFGDDKPATTPADPTTPPADPTTPPADPTTPPADPTTAPAGPATTPATDTRTFLAGPAGSVTLKRTATTLEVMSVQPKAGWTFQTLTAGPAEQISVLFAGLNGVAFEFHAKVDGNRVKIDYKRVGDKPKPVAPVVSPETKTVDAGAAGTVTLKRTGNVLELTSVQPANGWTYATARQGPGKEVKVLFLSAQGRLFFKAEVEDGQIDVETWPGPIGVQKEDGDHHDGDHKDGDHKDGDRKDGDHKDGDRRGDDNGGREDDDD